ncbi:MAG TPA: hypothetical protein VKZ59_08625 [Acidobacteriota bacterium]|nr:hypothetical protein [Acidobacteriota bacterium]
MPTIRNNRKFSELTRLLVTLAELISGWSIFQLRGSFSAGNCVGVRLERKAAVHPERN